MSIISRINSNVNAKLISIGYKSGNITLYGRLDAGYSIDHTFMEQKDEILYLVFDPLNEFLYSSSKDKSIAIYSIKHLNCVKLITDFYDLSNIINLSALDIINIAPHKYGLITCFLSNHEIHAYERYNYKKKYFIKILNENSKLDLISLKFVKDGEIIFTFDNSNNLYIYNFIKLQLLRKYEFFSQISLNKLYYYNEDLIYYINRNSNLKKIDLNKF